MKKKAAHDTFKQFNQKKTPAVVRGATNSLKVGCRNAKKTNKLDTCQQLEHGRCGEPNSVRNGNSVVDLGEFGDERGFSDERRELSRSFFAQGGKFRRLERFGRRGGGIGGQ